MKTEGLCRKNAFSGRARLPCWSGLFQHSPACNAPTFHSESAAAKIFNQASFPKEWNVTHSHAGSLQMTLVRIQPDYGCSEHRLKRPYCIQWQFDNEVTHLLYRRPNSRMDADFWTWP